MKLKHLLIYSISILLLTTPLMAQIDDNPIDCQEVISQLDTVMSTDVSIRSLDEIEKSKPELLVVAEFHYDHLFWKMSHVYKFFKNLIPEVNCLYSEISQDTSHDEIQDVINGNMNDIFYSIRRLGFGPLYESIFNIGDNVIMVDAPRLTIGRREEDNLSTWLTRRDSYMINRIKDSFTQLECNSGIYNIGAQHIWDNLDDPSLKYSSFGTRIKKEKIRTIVIDKGQDQQLSQCEWHGVKSFIAPSSNKQVRKFFKLDDKESSSDYILYLRSVDTLHALKQ